MKTLNRRGFVAVLATGAAGGVIVPQMVKSSPPPPGPIQALPFVSLEASYTSLNGSPIMPLPGAVLNALSSAGLGSSFDVAAPGTYPPARCFQAVENWAAENTPGGFNGGAVPQVALLEILAGVAVLAVGGYIIYHIWKWADTLLPPPDTNVYR